MTVRPCVRICPGFPDEFLIPSTLPTAGFGWPFPALKGGEWINLACGGKCPMGSCSCADVSEVLFPDPVVIESVEVDGVPLVEDVDWVLYSGTRLVRIGDEWPDCQDWEAVDGDGTWKVTLRIGVDVPTLGQMGVGALALEVARMCVDAPCNLPPEVQRVVRQGVTMEALGNPDEPLLTGVWLADRFIKTFNPNLINDRARAYSPDVDFIYNIQSME